MGTDWTSEIDGGSIGATGLTFLVGYSAPLPGMQLGMGELLIDPSSPWLLTSISPGADAISYHSLSVPTDPMFVGFSVYTQVFLNDVGGAGQLTNAIDLIIGF